MMKKRRRSGRLIFITIIFSVLIPLAGTLIIGPIQVAVGTDITYPEILADLLGYINEIIIVECVFAHSACLAYALIRKVSVNEVLSVCIISIPLIYAAAALVDFIYFGNMQTGTSYWGYILISSLFEFLRLAVVIAVCLLVRHGSDKKNRGDTLELFSFSGSLSRAIILSAVTVVVSLLISRLTETVMLFAEYGAPINVSEIIYLVLPYVTVVIYSMLGYLLMYAVASKAAKR